METAWARAHYANSIGRIKVDERRCAREREGIAAAVAVYSAGVSSRYIEFRRRVLPSRRAVNFFSASSSSSLRARLIRCVFVYYMDFSSRAFVEFRIFFFFFVKEGGMICFVTRTGRIVYRRRVSATIAEIYIFIGDINFGTSFESHDILQINYVVSACFMDFI